jgi:CMP-N,N'-diacetyllegionaminic acid synthase
MKKRIICIIPARGGSKGVPKKNIKLLNGKPLMQYTYEFAKQLGIFETICLSTDSIEIFNIGNNLGMEVPFLRPEIISTDNSSSLDVIKHAVEYYKKVLNKEFDFVCLLQPTVPFRDADLFLNEIILFLKQQEYDTLISFRKVPHKYNPEWVFKMNSESNAVLPLDENGITKRRQDLLNYYYRDGSLYLFKIENLLSDSIYGNSILPIILTDNNDVNIDTIEDWIEAEEHANRFL